MILSKDLLKQFNNYKNRYYDEAVVESKIIYLEGKLKNAGSNEEVNKLYKKLCIEKNKLQELVSLRLIEFIIEKFK